MDSSTAVAARLWAKVDRSGGPDACWPFTGGLTARGYGQVFVDSHNVLAHRLAYSLEVGPIPEGRNVDHQCHNRAEGCAGGPTCPHRACCNPAHLEPATVVENVRRSPAHNAAKTHCRHGHEFTAENTYVRPDGRGRECRACRRETMAKLGAS